MDLGEHELGEDADESNGERLLLDWVGVGVAEATVEP